MRLLATTFAVGCLIGLPTFAQTDRGTVTGTVTDPAGAVVANAPLELKGTETGTVYPTVTSGTGNYTFTQIPLGLYQLSVTVPGFKNFTRQNLRVQASQTLGVDIKLEVGSSTESITVSSEVSLLRTESSDVSTNVDGGLLTSLPILPIGAGFSSSHGVRNPLAVANLTPGTYFDPGNNLRVNGSPSNTMVVRVEGQDATTNISGGGAVGQPGGSASFQSQVQPSVDALQELSVQTSNYAAEYGQAGSGMFNYTVKSGTNQFHGSLYDYFSNDALNASQSYTGLRPKQHRNDFGGTIGGPVWIPKIYNGRNRTFFFFNYEEFLEKGTVNTSYPTVPTDAYRDGNFKAALSGFKITGTGGVTSDVTGQPAIDGQIFDPNSQFTASDGRRVRTPFPNNTIPATRFDPSAVKILALIPRANFGSGLLTNFNKPFATDRQTPIPALKIDHSFTDKAKISAYWSTTITRVQYCVPLCGSQGFPLPIEPSRGTFINGQTERVNFDYTLRPTLLLHLGAGFLENFFRDDSPVTNFDTAGALGISGSIIGPTTGARFPNFVAMTGGNSTGGMNAMGPGAQSHDDQIKPTFNASLTWVKNNHTFKFGGEARTEGYIQNAYQGDSGTFTINAAGTANPWFSDSGVTLTGGTTGFPFASFLLGRVSNVTLAAPATTRGGRKSIAGFAQDTWKVTHKLTLDYGLRWDYFTYPREQYGRTANFSPTVANATAGGRLGGTIFEGSGPGRCECSFGHNYPFAIGPRFGLAYQINGKTVLRAGAGVNYSSSTGGIQGANGASQTAIASAFGDAAMILSKGFPIAPKFPNITPNLFPDPATFAGQPFYVDNNAGRPARQIQWSIGIQREIIPNIAIEVDYVGNRGNWWQTSSLNAYNALTLDTLKFYGLDITSAADRAILSAQVGQAAAGRFRNLLPFAGFPTNLSVARALTPFPQFGPISSWAPLGKTWYDSMQAKVTKRFSHGLDASYNFTWSKELQLGADTDLGGGTINDVLNRDNNKQLSSFSRPFWNVLAISYTSPKWGFNKVVKSVVSDWTIGTVLQYGSGLPIPAPATATSNLSTALLRSTYAQRVPDQPLFLTDLNCHCFDPAKTQVLNPKAWTDPTPGLFSTSAAYYNDFRYERRPKETLSFGRKFRIKERVTLQIRAEFTNPFNRTQIPNPLDSGVAYTSPITSTAAANGVSVNNAGFGVIPTRPATAVTGERNGLLVAHFTF